MDITQQLYMIAIAESGSLTTAARRLGVSQPALSRWLDRLEEELGTQLVIRSKKQTVLTPAGRIYLRGARKMLDIRSRTYREMAGLSGREPQTLTVTGTPNGGAELFAELFPVFRRRFPETILRFAEAYNSQSLQMIKDKTADLGFCSTLGTEQAGLSFAAARESELVVMIPYGFPKYYDASRWKPGEMFPEIRLRELSGLPFVLPGPEMSYYEGMNRLFEAAGYEPEVIFRSSNVKAIYNMVRNGNGVGILPKRLFSPLDKIAPYSLLPHLVSHSAVVYRADISLTRQQQFVIDFIAAREPRPSMRPQE